MKFNSLSDLKNVLPQSQREKVSVPFSGKRHDGKGTSVRISLDTKGRKGKSVTVISGLQHNPQHLEEIASILKQYCGAGGTVKSGCIEIQGDQRLRITEKLKSMNYVVK
jgi:predicted translation initiation factor SUI1